MVRKPISVGSAPLMAVLFTRMVSRLRILPISVGRAPLMAVLYNSRVPIAIYGQASGFHLPSLAASSVGMTPTRPGLSVRWSVSRFALI